MARLRSGVADRGGGGAGGGMFARALQACFAAPPEPEPELCRVSSDSDELDLAAAASASAASPPPASRRQTVRFSDDVILEAPEEAAEAVAVEAACASPRGGGGLAVGAPRGPVV
eukprot:354070-Chlamydomonas_euryale.AAC.1